MSTLLSPGSYWEACIVFSCVSKASSICTDSFSASVLTSVFWRLSSKYYIEGISMCLSDVSSLLLLLLSCFSRVRLCATPRWQPTRLPRPWDSPGKNTGVGCHFLLHCMKVKSESEVTQSCLTLNDPMDCSLPGSSIHGIFQARVLEWGAIAFFDFLISRL